MMKNVKKILILGILIIQILQIMAQQTSKADRDKFDIFVCPSNVITIWPNNGVLYPASNILIQIPDKYFFNDNFFNSVKSQKLYLVSKNDSVLLCLIDSVNSKSTSLQLLYKPERELKMKHVYNLDLGILSDMEIRSPQSIFNFNIEKFPQSKKRNKLSWRIKTLHSKQSIFDFKKLNTYFSEMTIPQGTMKGVRHAIHYYTVKFNCSMKKPYIFRFKIKDLMDDNEEIIFDLPQRNSFTIGCKNTCFGNFIFRKGHTYVVSISIIDLQGNFHENFCPEFKIAY